MGEPALLHVTLKAAVWKGERLLLQREDQGDGLETWDLPGGRIDPGEDLATALARELREELGVEVASRSELPIKVWTTVNRKGIGVVALLYRVELASEDFDHSGAPEVVEADWLDRARFAATDPHPHHAAILELLEGDTSPTS